MRIVLPKYIVNPIVIVLLTIVASAYVFPVGFSAFLPSQNSKQFLGVIGVALFVYRCLKERSFSVSKGLLVSFMMACVFSLWCFFCCVYNETSDYAYATYVRSFVIWLGGAYSVCAIIRYFHGYIDMELLTRYFVLACVFQCVCVLLVDNNDAFMRFVDSHFVQGERAKEVDRLYGIGCSLDSGGVRMCMALVLIAHQLCQNTKLTENKSMLRLYIVAFMIIAVVGNMIARTTTVGLVLAIGYICVTLGIARRAVMTARQVRFWRTFFFLVGLTVLVAAFYYSTNPEVRRNIRFAFEVFFNFVEKGEFSTASSDVLMERMWVWPHDDYAWFVGYGLFEWDYFYGLGMQTDIGYCRFTLYCGLIGMILFSLYFMYNALVVRRKFRNSRILMFTLLALTFIIWLKVSTDIFQLYALLFCLPDELEEESEVPQITEE